MHPFPGLVALLLPVSLLAQFTAPKASQQASTSVTVGYTELMLEYHRPGVEGRTIFGGLLPYGELWRAGANENTRLSFSETVTIGDTTLEAGTYSLYVIPEQEGEWTWILNSDNKNWGTRGYEPEKDLVRVKARPRRLSERIETLEYRWMDLTHQGVELVLEWEWTRLSLPIKVATDEQVARKAAKYLNPAKDGNEYYEAARYYLENDNLRTAKAWIDRWAAAEGEQFGRTRRQAIIEYRLGNLAAADRLLNRSLQLARLAGNDHYVRSNERTLREWRREPVEISPDTLLARSISYHDPEGRWLRSSHMINLSESRADGTERHTRITLYPSSDEFDLYQIKGTNKIHMRHLDGKYEFAHQGRTEVSDSVRKALRLTEERTDLLRDYYTYLFGLPMKLRDPGTLLQPTVHRVWYDDRELLELEVNYSPETGDDIWFFLFDPETYALSGYRFYHADDGPDTGEYILLEDEADIHKMKIPKRRHWYLTAEKLYLGTDTIIE